MLGGTDEVVVKRVNLTPGAPVRVGRRVIEPGDFYTDGDGKIHQNQGGQLIPVKEYDDKQGRTGFYNAKGMKNPRRRAA